MTFIAVKMLISFFLTWLLTTIIIFPQDDDPIGALDRFLVFLMAGAFAASVWTIPVMVYLYYNWGG